MPTRPLPLERYAARKEAAKVLLSHIKAGTLADVLTRIMLDDEDSPSVDALLFDLEAAPLIPIHEISRQVHGGHHNTIRSVLSDALSPMQCGALREMAHGARNQHELGELLGCSKGSAGAHLERARVRLSANTTDHAIAIALGMGLFEPPLRHAAEGRFMARSLLRPRRKERDILERLARGMSNQEIADEIGLSAETVKDAIEDLREMYGARNRTHLVALAFSVGTLKFVSSRHTSEQALTLAGNGE